MSNPYADYSLDYLRRELERLKGVHADVVKAIPLVETEIYRREAEQADAAGVVPCGGCGALRNEDRCIGCLHDFKDGKSDWVHKVGKQC